MIVFLQAVDDLTSVLGTGRNAGPLICIGRSFKQADDFCRRSFHGATKPKEHLNRR